MVRGGALQSLPWREVRTGDIVIVYDKEEFPADVILLATSEELGKCFTEVPLAPALPRSAVCCCRWVSGGRVPRRLPLVLRWRPTALL